MSPMCQPHLLVVRVGQRRGFSRRPTGLWLRWYASVPPGPVGLPSPRACLRQALQNKRNTISGGSLGPPVLSSHRPPHPIPLLVVPVGRPLRPDNNGPLLSLHLPLCPLQVPVTHAPIVTACSAPSPGSASIDAERTKPSSTRRSTSRGQDVSGAPKSSA